MRTVGELIAAADEWFVSAGYAESTLRTYRRTWQRLIDFMGGEHVPFGREHEGPAIDEISAGRVESGRMDVARAVTCLLEVDVEGRPKRCHRAPAPEVPERFADVFDSYISDAEGRVAAATLKNVKHVVRHFLIGLKRESVADVELRDVVSHMSVRCGQMAPQSRSSVLFVIRGFLSWLAGRGMCDPSVAASLGPIPGNKGRGLPSTYSAAELASAVALPGTECPRRDRAMMLLASVLGMRAGDMRALRLDDLDWSRMEVTFRQPKTGRVVTLPLPDEVALAVADYLRNERPPLGGPHLFASARAPIASFEGGTNSFHGVTSGALGRAGVDFGGRHHGMHALRHSAAANMLSGGTPLPTITAVLGHGDPNTTRRYLSIDVEALRSVSLEVPDARR